MPNDGRRSRWILWPLRLLLLVPLLLIGPIGLLGVGLAREEGIELNILGLSAGIDLNDLALRLPGIGRIPAPDGV